MDRTDIEPVAGSAPAGSHRRPKHDRDRSSRSRPARQSQPATAHRADHDGVSPDDGVAGAKPSKDLGEKGISSGETDLF